jgi:hypothetical protein
MTKHDDIMETKQEIFIKRLPNSVQQNEAMLGNFTLAPLLAPLTPESVLLLKTNSQSDSKSGPK